MEQYPVARKCPTCDSASFTRVKVRGIAFTDDRKCKECGTRYTPPTPTWAAVFFIVFGGLLSGGSVALAVMLLRLPHAPDDVSYQCDFFAPGFGFPFGLSCLIYGIRSLKKLPVS